MPKNPGLKLFTKTWPPSKNTDKKLNHNDNNKSRPLTATLDKPTVLDITLMGIIDMSTVRKEFLNISNLCRFPITLKITRPKNNNNNNNKAMITRPLSLPSTEKHHLTINKKKRNNNNNNNNNKSRPETSEDSYEEESASVRSAKSLIKTDKKALKLINNNNNSDGNNKLFKIPRNKRVAKITEVTNNKNRNNINNNNNNNNNNEVNSHSNNNKSTKLPEPCKTCGRPDQPERFHSHPTTSSRVKTKIEEPPKMKSTVQKPVAIKYKSKKPPSGDSNNKTALLSSSSSSSSTRKASLVIPAQKLVHTPPNNITGETISEKEKNVVRYSAGGSKRTLTCYLCGREFGTASLPLHEPKCLEKWERENSALPANLQRKAPIKPAQAFLTREEYDKFAWESSQAILTPCENCGRTFFPDRLIVHQRSCKSLDNTSKSSSVIMPPPNIECYICGKKFGQHSIKIHEKQCLKKWHLENDSLPADIRAAEPIKTRQPANKNDESPKSSRDYDDNNDDKNKSRPESTKKPPMFPCYICGRLFTVNSIYIHEPQCLKMWKIENEKLPQSKRRPQPLKPDIKFTHDGKIDIEATNDANWRSHLSQLVPCRLCSRTFNPDRVEIHERSCKG